MARIRMDKDFQRKLDAEVSKKMDLAAESLTSIVKRDLRKGSSRAGGSSQPGQPPHADTGRLANSIFWTRDGKDRIVGTTVKYGLYLELGATVKPKEASALTIPISRAAKRHLGSARNFPKPLTLIPRPGEPPLLVEKQSGKWIIHYVLATEAEIQARPYLRPALLGAEFRARLRRIFQR